MEATRICDICGKEKPLSQFPRRTKFIESNSEKEVNICEECE